MDACKALKYWRDRRKRWCWAPVACAPPCRSWTSSPPRKRTTWSKSWTTGPSAPSTTSPPPYRRPARPCRRTCIRPPPGRTSMGESRLHIPLSIKRYIILLEMILSYIFIVNNFLSRPRCDWEGVRGTDGVVIVIKWESVCVYWRGRTHFTYLYALYKCIIKLTLRQMWRPADGVSLSGTYLIKIESIIIIIYNTYNIYIIYIHSYIHIAYAWRVCAVTIVSPCVWDNTQCYKIIGKL